MTMVAPSTKYRKLSGGISYDAIVSTIHLCLHFAQFIHCAMCIGNVCACSVHTTHSRMLYKSNEWNTWVCFVLFSSYLNLLQHIARDMPFTKYIRSIFASRTNSPTDQLPINCFSIDFIDIDAATHTLAYTIDVQKTTNRRNVKFSIVKFIGNEKKNFPSLSSSLLSLYLCVPFTIQKNVRTYKV